MKYTIKDIAKAANFSIKTVSRVMNNDPKVSDGTRSEILKTIKNLGYRPNIIARSLRQQKTNMVGFIIPDLYNPAFPMFLDGAAYIFDRNNYYSFLSCSNDDPKKEDEFIRDFDSMLISGLILSPSVSGDRDLRIFDETPTPIVILDRGIEGCNKDQVLFSNRTGAYDATKYMIDQGHKKIIFLCGSLYIRPSLDRIEGYKNAMKLHGLYSSDQIFYGKYTINSGYEMMKKVFESFNDIDAVFCGNDLIAVGAMDAINEKGLNIPEEISVFGFDDIYLSRFLKPPLSTVRQPLIEAGQTAAKLLLGRIKGTNNEKPKKLILQTSLVIRNTVSKR